MTRVKIDLPGHYDPVNFYFAKTCTFPKFQAGLVENAEKPDIIHDSVVQTSWNWIEKSDATLIYFWLPSGDVPSQTFRVAHYYYDHEVLNKSTHFTIGHTARPIMIGTPEASVHIDYQCKPGMGGRSANVNMTIDIGWNQQFTFKVMTHPTHTSIPV